MSLTERIEAIRDAIIELDRIAQAAEAAKAEAENAIANLDDCEGNKPAAQWIPCPLDTYADEIAGGLSDLRDFALEIWERELAALDATEVDQ